MTSVVVGPGEVWTQKWGLARTTSARAVSATTS